MTTVRLSGTPKTAAPAYGDLTSHDELHHRDHEPAGLFDGELLDLYAAIVIVVPLAWFLKSLWS